MDGASIFSVACGSAAPRRLWPSREGTRGRGAICLPGLTLAELPVKE